MDEAERAQLKAELRAELAAERQASSFDFSRQITAGQREDSWARSGQGASATANAAAYGTVLAMQMLAGMGGTGLDDDGLGDGHGTDL